MHVLLGGADARFRRLRVSIIGIVAATVAAMVIGGIYYAPKVLGARMMEMTKAAYIDRDPMRAMVKQVGFALVTALVMAWLFGQFGVAGMSNGVMAGLGVALIVIFADAGQTNFSGQPWSLWVLNAGNWLITFAVMGGLLGTL